MKQPFMKLYTKTLYSLLFVLFTSAMMAQNEVHFDESGFQSVMHRSKMEHKPVFYMLYASWCPHCTKMKTEVFKDSTVANFLNKNFVCAWQDIEKGEGESFKRKFRIRSFPTFIFLDEKGTLLYHFNGEYNSAEFIAEVKNVLIPEKQLPFLEKQFYDDPSNVDKCLAFLVALKKGSERTELNPHAQKYFTTQSDAQLVTENNWRIIANGVSDIESRPFQYVLQHQKEFAAVSSPKRVQKKIMNIVMESLQPYTELLDTVNYSKKRAIAKTINLQKTDSLIFRYDLEIAEKTKNWSAYRKAANESVEKYVWTDAKALTDISRNYASDVIDLASLKYAIKWMQHALAIKESYDADIVTSKLYRKSGDTKSAVTYAQKAKNWNGALGFNTKEADDLLIELGAK
jgi:thioredoxin-related protein